MSDGQQKIVETVMQTYDIVDLDSFGQLTLKKLRSMLMMAALEARVDEREKIAAAIDGMDRERYSHDGYWTKRVSDALDAAAAVARSGGSR